MTKSEVPFYTQAAILDRYIKSSNPRADPEVLKIILRVLESRQDLRDHFFRSGPSAAWAPILWEYGFFKNPPPRQKTETGYVLPRWDAQEYLILVASQVPDIVVMHIESVDGPGWYLSRAVKAVQGIPPEIAASIVPRITEWLEDPQIALTIAPEADELLMRLAENGQSSAAFDLFRALSEPLPSPEVKLEGPYAWGGEAVSKLKSRWDDTDVLPNGLHLLCDMNIQLVVSILKEHLCRALKLEAQAIGSPEFEHAWWWRLAIADTGEELDQVYRNQLLNALRDALEIWVQTDAGAAELTVAQLLADEREILRRLGLYLLYRFPEEYQHHVVVELRNTANLDEVSIRNELFLLLQHGYPFLEASDQKALTVAILSGPPADSIAEVAKRAERRPDTDIAEYVASYRKEWILDRLWMLSRHLSDGPRQQLEDLQSELGIPHPLALTRPTATSYWIRDVSPITVAEIAEMSPDTLVGFLREWKPGPDEVFGPEQVSYEGLGRAVATSAAENPERYREYLVPIASLRPEYAQAFLREFREGEIAASIPWNITLDFCEQLLANGQDPEVIHGFYEQSWLGVRRSLVWLLQTGLSNTERAIPPESLPKARDLLLVLIDDPDPEPDADQPPKGWLGHDDPATLALNCVRSSALRALIEYARTHLTMEEQVTSNGWSQEANLRHLEPAISGALTRKLDRREDPSWAVHSVFGRYLPLLYWLDREWVESHLDDIFPEVEDRHRIRFFVAAWDSFVIFNRYYPDLRDLLDAKYRRAISYLSEGYITQTHLQPHKGLATHVLWEYIRSEYDLRSPSGQRSLIVLFFGQAPPEARRSAVWALWRIVGDNPSEIATYWPRARDLWEWRVGEASQAGDSTDFDEEMQWFAHLPLAAPDSESIASMWPLLEGLLPHIRRGGNRFMGWRSVEDYLAREVDRDPERTIEFYGLMHQQAALPQWFYPREETRKILETAAAHPESCEEALSLIDLLARRGIHVYKDIYDRYADSCLSRE